MRKAVWLLLAVLAASLPAAARAAAPAHASAAAPAHASTAPAQLAPVSVGELQGLVDTLQDESARGKLVAQLQALIAAQRQTTPKKPEGIELLGRLSRQIDAFTGEILAGAAMVVDAPRLIFWAREQIYDPTARQRWVDAAVALVLVFGTAAAAEWRCAGSSRGRGRNFRCGGATPAPSGYCSRCWGWSLTWCRCWCSPRSLMAPWRWRSTR